MSSGNWASTTFLLIWPCFCRYAVQLAGKGSAVSKAAGKMMRLFVAPLRHPNPILSPLRHPRTAAAVLRSSRQLSAILRPVARGDTHRNRHRGKRPSEGCAAVLYPACKPCFHLRILHCMLHRNGFSIAAAVSPDAIWNHAPRNCLHGLKKL